MVAIWLWFISQGFYTYMFDSKKTNGENCITLPVKYTTVKKKCSIDLKSYNSF